MCRRHNHQLWLAASLALAMLALSSSPSDTSAVSSATAARKDEHRSALSRIPELVRIPAAEFLMGSPVTDNNSRAFRACDHPQRSVSVAEFWLGRYPVTAEEYCRFLNEVGNDGYFTEVTGWIDCRTIRKVGERYSPVYPETRVPDPPGSIAGTYVPQPGAERCPAYPVTWRGAAQYCQWLSEETGHEYRLPTETEWELAARGVELRKWPWGDEAPLLECGPVTKAVAARLLKSAQSADPSIRLPDPVDAHVPFYELCGHRWMYTGGFDEQRPWCRVPVGSFPPNATPEGVYDLLGYVTGQWCADVYDDSAYQDSERVAPGGADSDTALHVIRGGSSVQQDYDVFLRRTTFLQRLLMGEGKAIQYQTTAGRSWSRGKESPQRFGAFFRIASSEPPNPLTDGNASGTTVRQ